MKDDDLKIPGVNNDFDGLTKEEALRRVRNNLRVISEWADRERQRTARRIRVLFAVLVCFVLLTLAMPWIVFLIRHG